MTDSDTWEMESMQGEIESLRDEIKRLQKVIKERDEDLDILREDLINKDVEIRRLRSGYEKGGAQGWW